MGYFGNVCFAYCSQEMIIINFVLDCYVYYQQTLIRVISELTVKEHCYMMC